MTRISEIYAQALFDAAAGLGCIEAVAEELPEMEKPALICESRLSDPRVSPRDKAALLDELLRGKVSPVTAEFFTLMLRRGCLRYFPAAAAGFKVLCDGYFRRATVKLRVPFEPDPETLERLKNRFKEDGLLPEGAEDISFAVIEDKEIIGGFIAYCDGRQIDASLKTLLAKIRRAERYGTRL